MATNKSSTADDVIGALSSYFSSLENRLKAVEKSSSIGEASSSEASNGVVVTNNVPAAAPEKLSKEVAAYDLFFSSSFPPFEATGKAFSDDPSALKLVQLTQKAFNAQRDLLQLASQCVKPKDTTEFILLLTDLKDATKEMNKLRLPSMAFSNHQKMLNEGIQALGWVCVNPAPKPFIESYMGGAEFWGNKIRVEHKNSDARHVNFVVTFMALLKHLMNFVKEFCTTGMVWNPEGLQVAKYTNATALAKGSTSKAGVVAPKVVPFGSSPNNSNGGGGNAVFQNIRAIDQSQGKTAGLKTVSKDMQTWRKEYKGEKSTGVSGEGVKKPVAVKMVGNKTTTKEDKPTKPAVCELKNGKWVVEYQGKGDPVMLKEVHMRQQVYIYGCINAMIIIEGKAKSIVLDNCKNTKLIFDNAVSCMEIVNCKKVQVQCKGTVPSIAIDKTDGCLVYVSYNGKECHLVTSKSSEMNISFPSGPEADAEYVEVPIPEQFVHKITSNHKISSEVSDLYSG